MAEEELQFKAGVSVGEGVALRLKELAETSTQHDDIKPGEEVVVCQGNEELGCSESLAEKPCVEVSSVLHLKSVMRRVLGPLWVGVDMPGGGGY